MAPPEYSDVGKAARDLLSKEYNFGKSKFEAKSTTQSGVEFTSILERKHSDGTLRAELKSKLKHSESGLIFTDTYSSDNDLSIKIEAPNVADGLKLELDTSFSPNSGAKDFKAGSVFKTDSFITTFALSRKLKADANREGFIVKADAVVGHEGFVAGAQASFDASSSAFTDYSAVVGYSEKSYAITLHAEKRLSQFVATYNHIINKEVTVAAQATFASANKNVAIEFGAQYKLDDHTTLKAKADSSGNAGLGFVHKIRPDLKGTFGLLVDTRNLDQPAHRCGYSLTFEPK